MLKKIIAAAIAAPLIFSSPVALPKNELTAKQEQELRCLAENVYHEAKNQSQMGKMGVAYVTLNRAKHPLYPSEVCKVVYEKHKETCQFSWVCQNKVVADNRAYREARRIAKLVYMRYNDMLDPTEGALFFHAYYVSPAWARRYVKTVRIDDHIFYKTPRKT